MKKQFVTSEIALKLKDLGYKHYIDLAIEELDTLPLNNIEKRIEYSLVIDWLREKHKIHIELLHRVNSKYYYRVFIKNDEIAKGYNGLNYSYYECREQAILKAIELIENDNIKK